MAVSGAWIKGSVASGDDKRLDLIKGVLFSRNALGFDMELCGCIGSLDQGVCITWRR